MLIRPKVPLMWRARNSGGRQGRALIADWMITLAQARRKGLHLGSSHLPLCYNPGGWQAQRRS